MAKKTWDEKLAALSEELEKLSKKTATAAEDAKAVRELKEDALKEMISDTKGDIAAMQENLRIADEENKSKLSSALLKAQMTVRAKIEDHKVAWDKKLFEAYINDQIDYILDCYDSAAWLIANAQLAILETMDAVIEYDAKYGEKTEEAPAEEKPEA